MDTRQLGLRSQLVILFERFRKRPYDLDISFIKTEKFLKTKAVVFNLLLQKDANTKIRLYPPYKHVVWLDNLFTSIRLL